MQKGVFYLLFASLFVLQIIGCQEAPFIEKKTQLNKQEYSDFTPIAVELSPNFIKAKGLIEVERVQQLLTADTSFSLFEISKKENYKAGHLPMAQQLWRPDYESKKSYKYAGMRAEKAEIEALLSKKGAWPNEKIILYDVKGSCDALRFAWILKIYGYENVAIMNGGKAAWKAANLPLTKDEPPAQKASNFTFSEKENTNTLATFEEVQKAVNDTNYVLVDTRELYEYVGQPFTKKGKLYAWKKDAYTYGCIPSAVHLNWSDAVDLKGDHRFKCLKELKYNVEKAGISRDKTIIVYCQSGVRSAHTTYLLSEILGFPNVKNYDGSWIEWSYFSQQNRATFPIKKYTKEDEHIALFRELEANLTVE